MSKENILLIFGDPNNLYSAFYVWFYVEKHTLKWDVLLIIPNQVQSHIHKKTCSNLIHRKLSN